MLSTLLALLASTPTQPFGEATAQDGHLSVTATVVRPVDISQTLSDAGGAVLIIRNTSAVEVHAVGGTVTEEEPETTIVKGDETSSLSLTLKY